MKDLNIFITEKLKIKKSSYKYFPKTKEELYDILKQLIKKRGNEGDFNDIDTSEITDMSELFRDMDEFNGNISNWNVSNVKDMEYMFYDCENFNQDISKWNVSSVNDMSYMFTFCESFNQDLSNWDVYKVKYNYLLMFHNCPIKEEYMPKFK